MAPDATGVAAIFFRVLLSDPASREDRLYETTQRISQKILSTVKPTEKFGVEAYFNFRSSSEQAKLKDPAWEWRVGLPEGLLEQAQHLARREPKRPKAARKRRLRLFSYMVANGRRCQSRRRGRRLQGLEVH
jgi:hypothetical protein